MDLFLLLKATFQTVLRVLQIRCLILELLLDIRINLNVLRRLVLHVRIQVLVHNFLQLIEVVNVLDDPIDGILELANFDVILTNLGAVVPDHVNHVLLPGLQIVDDVAQVGVDFVVMLQVLIHLIRLPLQTGDLLASWRNVSLQLFDFVVQYKFEFLQLLSLLLELVDILLFVTDHDVSLFNVDLLFVDLSFEFFLLFLLEFELNVLVLNLTKQLISDLTQFMQLVLSELKLCLRPE